MVEITTRTAYETLERRLEDEMGFVHDQESHVTCRFRHPETGLILDVMPTRSEILGFDNRWQESAFPRAEPVNPPNGKTIRAIPPAFLLATKLEAFRTRGKDDFYGSRDFQDVVALVDGREELVKDVRGAPADLREYVSQRLRELTERPGFDSGIDGALPPSDLAQRRADEVCIPRIEALIDLPS